MQPTRLIWTGAGSPAPFDCDGAPIQKAKEKLWSHCACCGSPDGQYSLKDVISTNFVPVRNDSRLTPYGGGMFCAACVFCARTLRLRCCSWTATEQGIEFWQMRPVEKGAERPDALMRLLNPPEPPFVIGMPLYGIGHGGEAHWKRTPWPGETIDDVLIRLQSKHVALYARIGFSRDRYPVQVDDNGDFVVERALWLSLKSKAEEWMRCAVDAGVPPFPSKKSLLTLAPPSGVPAKIIASMLRLKREMIGSTAAAWWPLFCELILPVEKKETDHGNETEGTDHVIEPPRGHEARAESPSGAAPRNRKKNERGGNWEGQIQLTLF